MKDGVTKPSDSLVIPMEVGNVGKSVSNCIDLLSSLSIKCLSGPVIYKWLVCIGHPSWLLGAPYIHWVADYLRLERFN